MKQLLDRFSKLRLNRVLLLTGSVASFWAAVVLHNNGVLPLQLGTFVFFSFVLLLFALYRLGWGFLLFVGALPLEIINIAPGDFGGIMLRPYQWLTVIVLLAVLIRLCSRSLPFKLFRLRWFDIFPVLFPVGAFLSVIGSQYPDVAFKQAIVVTSFSGVYLMGRIFFQTLFDVRQALPFFFLSSTSVFLYALWQNIAFLSDQVNFAVMAGRPNATFSEPDWLGLFCILALGVGYTWMTHTLLSLQRTKQWWNTHLFLAIAYLTLLFTVLIITVARSAWLGAGALSLVFFVGLFFLSYTSFWSAWRRVRPVVLWTLSALFLAIGSVWLFHLSPFQFFNRIQSTGSGLERITVSCRTDVSLPEKINTVADLAAYDCRHIDLEVQEQERLMGYTVKEVFRPDPNIAIRKNIYQAAFGLIREHPWLGIGWGAAPFFLGTDERGAGLNASNMFLEVWLGSGLLGVVVFVVWLSFLGVASFSWYRSAQWEERLFGLFLLAVLSGLTVCNLFNSGLLLGFFFIFLSLHALCLDRLSVWPKSL